MDIGNAGVFVGVLFSVCVNVPVAQSCLFIFWHCTWLHERSALMQTAKQFL